jgi:hypothetical protein
VEIGVFGIRPSIRMWDGIPTCMAGGVVAGCFSPPPTEVRTMANGAGGETGRLHPFSMESVVYRIDPPIGMGNRVTVQMTGDITAGYIRGTAAEIFTVAILTVGKSVNAYPIAVDIGRVRLCPAGRMWDWNGVASTAARDTGKASVKIRPVTLFAGIETNRQNPRSMKIIIAGQPPAGWMGNFCTPDMAVATGAGLAGSAAVQVLTMALFAAFQTGHGNSQTVEC